MNRPLRHIARPGESLSPTRGFTFLEVMLVVMVIGLVMAVAMPDFRSLDTKTNLEGASRQMVGLFRYARARAIATGDYTVVDFRFPEDDAHQYIYSEKADIDRDGERRRSRRDEEPSTRQVFNLPERCYFTLLDTYEELIYEDGVRVYFYPDGTASPALITLAQERPARSGQGVKLRYYTVEIYRATGLTRSHPGQAESEEEEAASVPPLAGRRSNNNDFAQKMAIIRGY